VEVAARREAEDVRAVESGNKHNSAIDFVSMQEIKYLQQYLHQWYILHPMFLDDTLPSSGGSTFIDDDLGRSPPRNANHLDDVFGSGPPSPSSDSLGYDTTSANIEPSDINRLRSEHSTSGYRDGLSTAKSSTIQEGFDEGYSLGAVLGLEVGTILGILEGLYAAALKLGPAAGNDKSRLKQLVERARKDLKTEEVFGRSWWGEDGVWKYDVVGEHKDGGEDFTFREVVDSHPVVRRWKELVRQETDKWGVDTNVMERMDGKRSEPDDVGEFS
jgi:hypothetical protein